MSGRQRGSKRSIRSDTRRWIVGLAIVAAVATSAGSARADSGTTFGGEVSLGGAYLASASQGPDSTDPGHQPSPAGLAVSLLVRVRRDCLVAGLGGEKVITLFSHGESFLGAHAGLALGNESAQWDILAEGGVHFVNELGSGLLTHTDAPTVALPYAGVRFGGVTRRGSGPNPGFWIFARFDLARTATVAHLEIIDQRETITYDVGGHTVGIVARFVFGR